jgi:hypothetical protein
MSTRGTGLLEKIQAAESKAVTQADVHADELRTTRDRMPALVEAAEVAKELPDEIVTRWKAGEDVPTTEYAEAQAQAVRAQAVLDGTAARIAFLERATPLTECELADVLVGVFENAAEGIPVLATFAQSPSPSAAEGPVIIIEQSRPTKHEKDGTISGEVWASFHRRPIHRNLTTRVIEEAATELDFLLSASAAGSREGVDRFKIVVKRAHPPTPALPSVDPLRVSNLSNHLAGDLARILAAGSEIRFSGGEYKFPIGTSRSNRSATAVESVEDGVRLLTVSAAATVSLRKMEIDNPGFSTSVGLSATTLDDREPKIRESLSREWMGRTFFGLGVCDSLTFTRSQGVFTVEAVFRSAVA